MIEVYLTDRILSFDGRIIESFDWGKPSSRYHIAWVTKAEIHLDKKGRQFIVLHTRGGLPYESQEIPPEAQPAASEFIAAVQKAMRQPL
jgi:hypothetical protein